MTPLARWIALAAALALGCTTSARSAEQCRFSSDCESPLVCLNQVCRAPCATDADCAGAVCARGRDGVLGCVPATGPRPCLYTSDCPATTFCTRDGVCQAQCRTDYDCQVINPLDVCREGACVFVCAAGHADCDGVVRNGCEVDTRRDDRHCGACGTACSPVAGAVTSCRDGACVPACQPGFGDCDGVAANGCEADLSQPAHCGACNQSCAGDSALCLARTDPATGDRSFACAAVCPTGTVRCGATCVDTASDAAHCGSCDTACPAGPGASPRCDAGRCALRCDDPSRQADCDGVVTNGCETELTRSPANCMACGRACAGGDHAAALCAEGSCGLTCDTGYGNCDGDPGNGCEADLRVTPGSCGMCGMACPTRANATATCAAGACGIACAAGYGNCDGDDANGCEADLSSSAASCGACGTACATRPHTAAECVGGACQYPCAEGFADCDGDAANGCEVTLATDPANCGGCGRACSRTGGSATCAGGVCGIACDTGTGDCDGDVSNGCETNTRANALHCGMCRNVCSFPEAGARCDTGVCVRTTCATGRGDCDGMTANGCETDLNTTVDHCGACGNRCVLAHATSRCAAGACRIGACDAGWADCDGNPANGCEANLATDALHCGGCTTACSTAHGVASCVSGACRIACADGFGDCDGMVATGCETPTSTSVPHCGACGHACALANATPVCAAGTCAVGSCNAGFGDCDRSAGNGCEVNLGASAANCGACGRACALPFATAACASGACAVAMCTPGHGNCDGVAANGCEVDTTATPAHCGACGRACALPFATAGCAAGACTVASCAAGHGNCDGNAANGCEVDLTSSNANCGACGRACAAGTVCSMGTCASVCAAPTTYCSGACVDLATSPTNCGSCGNACPVPAHATRTCARSTCGYACVAGWGDCDGVAANGCETDLTTTLASCGACRAACARANATAVCAAGACTTGVCAPGFGNCDMVDANGCETNLRSTVAHCGACGSACGSANGTPRCLYDGVSICAITCNAGFGNCDGSSPNGCEVDLTTSSANCGACGTACAAGTHCAASLCVPDNDTCDTATAIDLTRGSHIDIPFTTVNANHTTTVDTNCATVTGGDVFFRITLTQRELLYADTFGTGFDTVLFFAYDLRPRGAACQFFALSPRPGEVWCNDDAARTTGDYAPNCVSGGAQSQVAGFVGPGTYWLAVAGYSAYSGTGTIHFEHIPVTTSGAVTYIPEGVTGAQRVFTGQTLVGTSAVSTTCGGGGRGPENSYWFRTCPNFVATRFRANTCTGTLPTPFVDTVLEFRNGSGAGTLCNDDQGTACSVYSNTSNIDVTVPAGAGIHVLDGDTYNTSATGAYNLVINPIIITLRDGFPTCRRRYARSALAPWL